MMFIRHLLSFLALPFTVTAIVPLLIARRNPVALVWPPDLFSALGALALAAGLLLFGASLYEFVTRGRGTLAPWDPPRALVIHGPYRYVRNPMISGVVLIVTAEALLTRSAPVAQWAATFAILNLIYIPLLEEPQLAERFGEPYREYRRHVRRFVPRLTAWPG
ncbi:MAG: phospholipid methyltransferase [Acidobacteria bacterium]|nr:phospholipid methyltransferase [Acidobacteriota bacterium]